MADPNANPSATFGGGEAQPSAPATITPWTKDNFNYDQYISEHPYIKQGGTVDQHEYDRAWADYNKKYANNGGWGGGGIAAPAQGASSLAGATNIVPGNPKGSGDINVTDAASDLVKDPSTIVGGDRSLQEQAQNSQMTGNEAGTNINGNDPKYQMDPSGVNYDPKTVDETAQANPVDPRQAQTYDPNLVEDKVRDENLEAAQGEVSDNALVDIEDTQIDTGAIAAGTDKEGVGEALKDYASQDLGTVDQKATVKGQLEMLQDDFTDPVTGEPRIPNWAASTARSVAKITAFSGKSGTAANAAMAQALMEASVPVAQADAQFFQTLTLQNLSNEQASIINRANVLANMTLANQDARVAGAIQNAQAFLAMDMKNLDNEQQARVINNQNRINAMFEDSKQINAQRLFTAQSQNQMDMFYDNLNSQVEQFNAAQTNNMSQFNVGQENAASQFNSQMENNRQQFYQQMQYQIDTANAKWRQTVTLTEDAQSFEAAATDVKNMNDLTQEMLNQLWDRSDSLLQYAWQSSENEAERKAKMAIAQFQANAAAKAGKQKGIGAVAGAIGGSFASAAAGKIFDSIGW